MTKKDIMDMTVKDFKNLPGRKWYEDIGKFDSLVILPTRKMHDSGFMCMDFVAVRKNEPICRLSGCSDVLHIDGIGGFGEWELDKGIPSMIPPKGWSIDCLPCGLLRLFCLGRDGNMEVGVAVSSFEVYSAVREE